MCMKMFFRKLLVIGAGVLCAVMPAHAEDVDVDELLYAMRDVMVSQGERDVMGTIRKGRNKVPFSLSARGETIVFQYKYEEAWQRFDVRIKESNVDLVLVNKGKAQVMAPSSYGKSIAGTDVCYEDLSMRFLYWKGGRLIEDSANARIKGRDCYIVEVKNPTPGVGQFAWVRMWVDKDNGTTWQIDGYGADGKLKKRFSISSVQQLSDGSWFFKQMRLEVRNPKDPNRTIALNYLEMEDLPESKK